MSFADLINEIRQKGNDGKDFEVFCKWFLLNDPYWKTQVDEVWLWDDWPQRWDRDKGVDLVFRHKNGEMWAVQSKCYAETTRITKQDVDSFLTDSNRKIISKRLLMASTNSLGRNAIETITGQEKPVVRWMLDDFENSAIVYPQALSELNKSAETKEHEDRLYQLEAVEAVVEGLNSHDRGQLIMACGTGKTFVTLWIKERLKPQTCLVLLPSLSLLSQTLHEWTANCRDEFEVLCVCSDATVGKRNTNEDLRISEAPFDVTSNTDVIRTFLKQSRPKVIFCTYQSSELIGEAQGNAVIDLVVCDEAHRCAGPATASFTKVLDDKFIKAKKRLFTTATPRVFSKATVKSADARGQQIYGMDDETIFGPILHTYSFGQAIEDKWLTDYQVVIVGVDEPTIRSYIKTREIVGSVEAGIISDAETLAAKLSLLKATSEYDLRRVISFHGRVKAAKEFSSEYCDLIDLVEPSKRPSGEIWTDYVSGEMSAGDRKQKIQRLKKLPPDERGLLANARCLSEGVDVPSLDGVAFIDPKGSQIDIIQAVGRALRKSDEKKFGTIILPVFVEPGDDEIERIEKSNFKPVWDVLKALRSHDERLGDSIDGIRTELGKHQKTKRTLPDNIVLDLPVNVGDEFSESLKTYLVEVTSQSWHFWYGLLEAYVAENGNAWVPQAYEINGHSLGMWLGTQRRIFNKGLLSKEKIGRLESLNGFYWDPIEEKWQIGLSYVKKHIEEHGHSRVKYHYKADDGYPTGKWVHKARIARDKFPPADSVVPRTKIEERNKILEALPGWSWGVNDEAWQTNFLALCDFAKKHGHAYPTKDFVDENGVKLGNWVRVQRQNYKLFKEGARSFPERRRTQLESITGWSWVGGEWEIHPNAEMYELKGKNVTLRQVSETYKLPLTTIRNRLNRGWSIEQIVATPKRSAERVEIDGHLMKHSEAQALIDISASVYHRLIKKGFTAQQIKNLIKEINQNGFCACNECGKKLKSTVNFGQHFHNCRKFINQPHPNAKVYDLDGQKMTIAQISSISGINASLLQSRLGKGKTAQEAIALGKSNKSPIIFEGSSYKLEDFLATFKLSRTTFHRYRETLTLDEIITKYGIRPE